MDRLTTTFSRFPNLVKVTLMLFLPALIVAILVYGKPFLMPLTFAALLAMLLLPMCQWLERHGIHRAIAALLSILAFVSFFAAIIVFISVRVSDLSSGATKIEERVKEKYQQAQEFISKNLGISEQKQEEMLKKQQSGSTGKVATTVTSILAGIGGFLANLLLVLVYIFLFLYFRHIFKRFVLRITSRDDEPKALSILNQSQKITQKYLTGLALMIMALWVMYGIGFSIAGVKHPIFFAVLCGVLEIVPFVGNVAGTTITVLFALVQGGSTNVVIGILVTYAVVQFIQTYILEPLVVGSEVSINPLFTIVALIAGEMLWGISGMVLAIPLLGVAKIAFDHIEPLKPFGELIGEEKKSSGGGKIKKKMNQLVEKVKGKF